MKQIRSAAPSRSWAFDAFGPSVGCEPTTRFVYQECSLMALLSHVPAVAGPLDILMTAPLADA